MTTLQIANRPVLQVIGDLSHPDFRDAAELLYAEAQLVKSAEQLFELLLVAQSRPGVIDVATIDALRRAAPLAGIVALVGSWCEGETRTGRPWPGIERLHWYEFPSWWQRQMVVRAGGGCPDWLRQGGSRHQTPNAINRIRGTGSPANQAGLVVLRAAHRDTANTLSDDFRQANYATAWQAQGRSTSSIHGAIAGVWEGGQLSDEEAEDLSQFCRQLALDGAPVVALLDFPRRDCVDRAKQLGVAAVLGKPWRNADLLATLQRAVRGRNLARAA